MDLTESAMVNESQELPQMIDMEMQNVHRTSVFPSSPSVSTPPSSSAPHSTPVTPPGLHPIIVKIRKDDIASFVLKNQLLATIVASIFTLISDEPENYESTGKIILGLLGLNVLAFIVGNVLRDERPVIAAAAELAGISLGAAAFIYPMSILLGGPILCYVPPIIGGVVAGMYIYRLATASGGDTNEAPGLEESRIQYPFGS